VGGDLNTAQAKTILIAEDEDPLRELVRVSLGGDYLFAEAADGSRALELVFELEPDLIVLDLMLPGTSGVDVLAAVRAEPAIGNTPVVVISAWTHAQQAAVDAGADRFVPKPFDPDELKAIVDELLMRS